ncbi:CRTAC1 family protein [Aestuariivirga sp.]|uniref:CRTAC1 family protein n=1 Tax=Aestuariivirga sp. TaxID=2650926 RepID=UPI0039195B60
MKILLSTLAALGLTLPAAAAPVTPRFVEETASAGIDSVYAGEWQYMVGGGAAVFDCNGDGFEDVLIAGGENPATFYVNRSARGGPLSFARRESGLEFGAVTGAYPLDIDGDGRMDLVVLRVGENIVMRGEGDCRFTRANEAWGFDGGDGWSTAFAATWEEGQHWPTLAIGNYIDRNEELEPWGSCTANWLHRPEAGEKGFAPPVTLAPSHCPLSMLFTDWSNSGEADLRVSNDREYYEGGQEQMWRISPGKPPALYTREEGWRYLRIWGMGLAGHDLDGDGYQEYFLTSMADNKLQTLAKPPKDASRPRPDYKDIAFAKGVTAHRPFMGEDLKPSTAWHTEFEDVNNDGRADLFIAKGNVDEMPDFAIADPNNLLVQQEDGRFAEGADQAGVASTRMSRGGALADFNLDGRVDLLVVNRRETAQVWRNVTEPAGNWLMLRLAAGAPNADAVGAFIEVKAGGRAERREITAGGGHVSGQMGWVHFGLGEAPEAQVRVRWPGGGWSKPLGVKANGFVLVRPGVSAVESWAPPR